jgi:hypothetical protein
MREVYKDKPVQEFETAPKAVTSNSETAAPVQQAQRQSQ